MTDSERATRLNVGLVPLWRLQREIWLYNEVCSMALMAALHWSFGKISVTVPVYLYLLPSGSQASQITFELSSPTEAAPTGNKQHKCDIKAFVAQNRHCRDLILKSGAVWHSLEIDSPSLCPNENPLPRIA